RSSSSSKLESSGARKSRSSTGRPDRPWVTIGSVRELGKLSTARGAADVQADRFWPTPRHYCIRCPNWFRRRLCSGRGCRTISTVLDRPGCPASAAGQDGTQDRTNSTTRIGCQRVEPAAYNPALLGPACSPKWRIARAISDRKRQQLRFRGRRTLAPLPKRNAPYALVPTDLERGRGTRGDASGLSAFAAAASRCAVFSAASLASRSARRRAVFSASACRAVE